MCTYKEYEYEKEAQRLLRRKLNEIFREQTEQLQRTLNKFKNKQL